MTVTTPFIEGFLSPGPAEQIHEHITITGRIIQQFFENVVDKYLKKALQDSPT